MMPDTVAAVEKMLEHIDAQERNVRRVAIGAFIGCLIVVLIGLFIVRSWTTHHEWSPVGDLPTQEVISKNVTASGSVQTLGTKCFKEVPLEVSGAASWKSVDNPGLPPIDLPAGGRAFDPRHPLQGDKWARSTNGQWCVSRVYTNPVPPQVAQFVKSGGSTVWQISGTLTPTRSKGEGVTRRWFTEPFEVLAR